MTGTPMPPSLDPALEHTYRQRARRFAEPPAAWTDRARVPVLVGRVGTERYVLALTDLVEVVPCRRCTPVPGAPAALAGVISVRGQLTCVIDLRRALGLPSRDDAPEGYVALLRGRSAGLRIDEIDGLQHLDPAELAPGDNAAAPGRESRFVRRVTAGALIVLDFEAVLSGASVSD